MRDSIARILLVVGLLAMSGGCRGAGDPRPSTKEPESAGWVRGLLEGPAGGRNSDPGLGDSKFNTGLEDRYRP